jgi:acid phosphatase
VANGAKASALDGPPSFAKSGNITPANYFGDGTYHAVNTMQPAYQPSGNPPATADADTLYANPDNPTTLPPQSQPTIGDRLDAKHVPWIWYAGSWNVALADGRRPPQQPRQAIYAPLIAGASPDFQPHHQPFNYYEGFDPIAHAAHRTEHLKDYDDLISDAAAGRLPPVVFYKPQGNFNQHPGYASIAEGDAHIAAVVAKLRSSPQWAHMVIVITYDEFGGAWDHMPPPAGDLLNATPRSPPTARRRWAI